jgi:uncharacterized protein (DUF433 family)
MPEVAQGLYQDRSQTEVPLYSFVDAAHHLSLSHYKLWLLLGLTRSPRELTLSGPLFSFQELATLFVESVLVRWAAEPPPHWRDYVYLHVTWHQYGVAPVLPSVAGARCEEFVAAASLWKQGGIDTHKVATARPYFASRVELKDGTPVRIYPFTRARCSEDAPRPIAIDPAVRFGAPVLSGTGVPTEIIFERFQAGETVALLAEDYDIEQDLIQEAIRYESMAVEGLWATGDR